MVESKIQKRSHWNSQEMCYMSENNDVPATITPAAHTPAPPGPFRHLQVDYISLPPCKGKTDVLVVIDKFSDG